MIFGHPILSALLILASASVSALGAAAQSADEKALATYRLTMPNVKKVMAVVQSLADEAAKDPKVQELEKLKKQMKPLQEKDELTEAEQAQLDKQQERVDSLEREQESKDDDSPANDAQTIASMEAAIKKHPMAMSALSREGLSARDYAMTMMALLQASMVEGFSQGKVDMKNLPPGINPDNILFVREHKAELEAMQKAMAPKK